MNYVTYSMKEREIKKPKIYCHFYPHLSDYTATVMKFLINTPHAPLFANSLPTLATVA